MPHNAGHLYACKAEGTPSVKIGYVVSSIEQRLRSMRSQHPFFPTAPVTLLATVRLEQDLAQVEHQLHRLLAAHRYQGEWYTLSLTAEAFRALVQQAQAIAYTLNADRRQLTPEQRREVVATLRQEGHSYPAIAGALGVHHTTIMRDVATSQAPSACASAQAETPNRIIGLDGKVRPATRPLLEPREARPAGEPRGTRLCIQHFFAVARGLFLVHSRPSSFAHREQRAGDGCGQVGCRRAPRPVPRRAVPIRIANGNACPLTQKQWDTWCRFFWPVCGRTAMNKLLRGEPYADRPYSSVPMNFSFDRETALLICKLAPNAKARAAFLTRLVYAEVGRLEERKRIIADLVKQ